MQKDKQITEVQFRIFKGEIVAIFPYDIYLAAFVTSYARIGQHSACSWDINNFSKPATPEQYKDLKTELENIGYNLKVIKRRNHSKYLAAYYKTQKVS